MTIGRNGLAAALLVLGGCATISVPPADPAVSAAADQIAVDAQGFYTALAAKTAPACALDANADGYARLKGEAAALRAHLAPASDPPLKTAVDKLDAAIAGAEHSHQLASAKVDDPAGPCLAPEVLTLNADAVARAAAGIKTLEAARESR